MNLIECTNLKLSYENNTVISDLSFEIDDNDYVCITGENGSGKSTLIKTLLGLKKQSAGTITYGKGIKSNEIGYLPQQTKSQKDFPASVYEVVISGFIGALGARPFYSAAQKKKALENIEKLGISHLSSKSFRELSGGQQQRVLIARALCATKKLLLLDEPTSGLDPLATHELYDSLAALVEEGSLSVVMVTHDIGCALKHAKKVLHLHSHGFFFGSADEYKNSSFGKSYFNHE